MEYDYGNWLLVILNIALFLYFIKSAFKPRTKTDWTTFRYFGAFIVALFAEMYGFPLTIYLLTSYFGNRLGLDFTHNNGHLLNTLLGLKGDPHFNMLHIVSYALIIGGLILLGKAWKVLYEATKQRKLATDSVYKYIRHPQYLAFILIIFGFLVQWPTFITLLMAPVLIFRYILLARAEEKEMLKMFGREYVIYKARVPGFFPSKNFMKILYYENKDTCMQQVTNDKQQNEDSEEIVTDLVCGMVKPKSEMKFTSEFLGKTYYFDTDADKELFDEHPDYWIPQEERDKARSNFKTI